MTSPWFPLISFLTSVWISTPCFILIVQAVWLFLFLFLSSGWKGWWSNISKIRNKRKEKKEKGWKTYARRKDEIIPFLLSYHFPVFFLYFLVLPPPPSLLLVFLFPYAVDGSDDGSRPLRFRLFGHTFRRSTRVWDDNPVLLGKGRHVQNYKIRLKAPHLPTITVSFLVLGDGQRKFELFVFPLVLLFILWSRGFGSTDWLVSYK